MSELAEELLQGHASETDIAGLLEDYLEDPTTDRKFNYAWALVSTSSEAVSAATERRNVAEGIKLLSELLYEGPNVADYLYYIAVGKLRLGDLPESRHYCELLIERGDKNRQAKALMRVIESRLSRDGLLGMAMVSTVAAGIGMLGYALLKGKR